MARKSIPADEDRIELNPDEVRAKELADEELLNDMDDGELFRVTDEIRASDNVRLMFVRVWPNEPGKRGFVGEMSPAEFTTERAARVFGPGRYKVRPMGPRGFIKGGGTLEIAEPAAPLPGESMDIATLLKSLDERDAQRRLASNERTMEYVRILAPIVGPIVAALMGRNSSTDIPALISALKPTPPPSLNEFAATLASLKALGGEKNSDLEVFMRALEFSKDLNRGDHQTGWMDIVKEIAGPLVGKVTNGAMGPAFPLPPRQVPPTLIAEQVSEPAQAQPAQGQAQDMNAIQWMQFFHSSLDQLIHQAARNRDPGLYAEVLVDNLPEESSKEKLLQFLGREDWWNAMSKFHGGVLPYQGWFTQLREQVILILTDKETESEDEAHVQQ